MMRDQLPAWQAVLRQAQRLKGVSLRTLPRDDAERWITRAGAFTLDLGKQKLDDEALAALLALADATDLAGMLRRQFAGELVNSTERRAVLHTALRLPAGSHLRLPAAEGEGPDIVPGIHASLARMQVLVERIHSGQWRGSNGYPIRDIVNIGVGGSDLGPYMACHALAEFAPPAGRALGIHFVSSIDGSELAELLDTLRPETTLFIISSKSFTTSDTLANARTAMDWLGRAVGSSQAVLRHHIIGVSACPAKMDEFGIPAENQLLFWDWVGGRFSLWSVIGLPIALRLGMAAFRQFLAGAHWLDCHTVDTPLAGNLPVLLGLVGVWNASFLDLRGHAILPYDGRLAHFPAYLTQLEMESNGKSVTHAGERVSYATCPVLWGEVGPLAQHAFYQLLHQGTQPVSCDFIAPVRRYEAESESLQHQHRLNLANCLAQARVLAFGDACLSEPDASPHRRYPGDQPSTTLLLDELTPYTLGALVALYEHKVAVMAAIWDINAFDQWGVELGKRIAGETEALLRGERGVAVDASTAALVQAIRRRQMHVVRDPGGARRGVLAAVDSTPSDNEREGGA